MVEKIVPPKSSMAARNSSSWQLTAPRMAASFNCHSRVEPTISVNRNVTVPDGAPITTQCATRPPRPLHPDHTTNPDRQPKAAYPVHKPAKLSVSSFTIPS
jgi:hypothetical protein